MQTSFSTTLRTFLAVPALLVAAASAGSQEIPMFGPREVVSGLSTPGLALAGSPRCSSGPEMSSAEGRWQQLPPPPWLIYHGAIYDPVRDRMLLFAGTNGLLFMDELWELSLAGEPQWRRLRPTGTAPPRIARQGMVYDPLRDRVLVFGGGSSIAPLVYHNQIWALSLAGEPQWTQLAIAGTLPTPRDGRQMVYDSIADRVLVFGGATAGATQNDVWSLSLEGAPTWSPVVPSGTPPSPRSNGSLVFDPIRNRAILFGGLVSQGGSSTAKNDTWELSLAGSPAWREMSPAGTVPVPRFGHAAFYEPTSDRIVVLNGSTYDGQTFIGIQDAYALSLGAEPRWSQIAAPGPMHPGGAGGSAVYDSSRHRALLFGGWFGNTSSVSQDVWGLSFQGGETWAKVWTADAPPATGRTSHTAILDPIRRRMIVFGGEVRWSGEPNPFVNDLWALELDSPYAWTRLQPSGVPPTPRAGHTAIYDPKRDRMIVFGGVNGTTELRDLWTLSLSGPLAWQPLIAAGTPPAARHEHTAIYDPVRDRMIVYGGQMGTSLTGDTWQLSLSATPTWTQISAPGPGPNAGHSAIYDPSADRMIVFGGWVSGVIALWQLWLSATPQWSTMFATGTPPGNLVDHTAVVDGVRGRMLVFGGLRGSESHHELFALELSATPSWTALESQDVPGALWGHTAVYDPVNDGMWVYGGLGTHVNQVAVYWPAGGPTRTWIQSFTLARAGRAVEVRWVVADGAGNEEFELVASRGSERWPVPIEPPQGRIFVAQDRSPLLDAGGTVSYTLSYRDPARGWVVLASSRLDLEGLEPGTRLLALQPNPARDRVAIPFILGHGQRVCVTVHDVRGREVARLFDGTLAPGSGQLSWPGTDGQGRRVPAGVYLIRFATPDAIHTGKVVLAR